MIFQLLAQVDTCDACPEGGVNNPANLRALCTIGWFCRILGLPATLKHFDDLLGKTAKKGAMKTTAAASRSGAIQHVSAKHLGDGQPLELNMQVRLNRGHSMHGTGSPWFCKSSGTQ